MVIESGLVLGLLNDFKIIGSVVSALGFLFGVFKVINWVKAKFINIDQNVMQLKNTMETNITGLREDIKAQTHSITQALGEQRADFRTFYAPQMLMQQMSSIPKAVPARAKRTRKK